MTTLDELRNMVRAQTQTTGPELPDPLIDWYLEQGYQRTINAEVAWPFFEQEWSLTIDPDQTTAILPGDVNVPGIITLINDATGWRLEQIPQWLGEDNYGGQMAPTTFPVQYSIWGNEVNFWPVTMSSEVRTFTLRGYRKPILWLTSSNEPDCDARLHLPLVHYAVALAYEQQEDETLNTTYMDRWQRDVEMAHAQIMKPRHHRPLIGAGSIDSVAVGSPGWVLVPPAP